jgi:KUP system potassium uptake protein
VVPLSLVVLVALFLIQKHGTDRIGKLFGPIMVLWFLVLGGLGCMASPAPGSAQCAEPGLGRAFLHGAPGHGRGDPRRGGAGADRCRSAVRRHGPLRPQADCPCLVPLVLPALVLNYFGQGALLLENPEAARNPFYLLAPSWALIPLVGLATLATVIASQAVISGAFSLTRQAIQLGYIPRMHIQHTPAPSRGRSTSAR